MIENKYRERETNDTSIHRFCYLLSFLPLISIEIIPTELISLEIKEEIKTRESVNNVYKNNFFFMILSYLSGSTYPTTLTRSFHLITGKKYFLDIEVISINSH